MSILILLATVVAASNAFIALAPSGRRISNSNSLKATESGDDLSSILTERFPTSVDDQVRQAGAALRRASQDGIHRHAIRLLLPIIGATDLDDWPGGTRQMAEAANPLCQDILKSHLGATRVSVTMIDESDGVGAIMAQGDDPKNDSCTVLLPTADTVGTITSLHEQVGPSRDLILVNTQWKRRTDFGFFGRGDQVEFVASFVPSFYCSNLMVEGEQVRILRSHPGPWRVFLRLQDEDGAIDWRQIGDKPFMESKPSTWDTLPVNARDGGKMFDFGQPTYQEIEIMICSREEYQPKSLAERASAAFTFIKDTL